MLMRSNEDYNQQAAGLFKVLGMESLTRKYSMCHGSDYELNPRAQNSSVSFGTLKALLGEFKILDLIEVAGSKPILFVDKKPDKKYGKTMIISSDEPTETQGISLVYEAIRTHYGLDVSESATHELVEKRAIDIYLGHAGLVSDLLEDCRLRDLQISSGKVPINLEGLTDLAA